MSDPQTMIQQMAQPLAAGAGLDLLDVEVKGSGSRTRVRIIVDRKGGVDVGTCQKLSRAVEAELDDVDPLRSRYTLEVTSPGTDRPLRSRADFDRIEGRTVRIRLTAEDDGERPDVIGAVRAATDDHVVVEDKAGDTHQVGYDDIDRATQELPW